VNECSATPAGDLVGAAGVGPADESVGVVEPEGSPLPIGEEVDPVHPEAQMAQFGIEHLVQRRHGRLGADGMKELRAGLDTHRRQMTAGGEADAGHLVVEAEAVLAPAIGRDAEDDLADLTGVWPLGLAGPRPAVLEAGEEPLGQFGAAREIEGVDAGRQLAQTANWRICD